MANKKWSPAAAAVRQVATFQVTAYHASTTYRLTVGGKTVSTIAAGGVNQTVTALVNAWNASTDGEFSRVTASTAGADVGTLTADDAGVPFTATSSVSGGTGTIGAVTTTTAADGPSFWSSAANWSPSGVPANADNVYLENSSVDILYGLDQSAVTLASLNVAMSYTGKVGLPNVNEVGSYPEYQDKYLKISADVFNVGGGPGGGSGRVKIDAGSVEGVLNVTGTGTPAETGLEAMLFVGTHADNELNITKGSLGVAVEAGQVSTFAAVRVGYQQSPNSDVSLRLGPGVTLAAVDVSGGVVETNSAATTVGLTDGTLTHKAGAVTTLNVDGGTVYHTAAGTVTNLNVGDGGSFDRTRTMTGCTVTNCSLYAGSTLLDPYKTVAFTNGIDLVRCGLADLKGLDLGTHWTLSRGVI